MKILPLTTKTLEEIRVSLAAGGVVCMPTDTVFGLLGLATNSEALENIYHLKKRAASKPFIILCADVVQVAKYFVLNPPLDCFTNNLWPGPISILLPMKPHLPLLEPYKKLFKTTEIVVRIPDHPLLRQVIRETGPLVAPSANPAGLAPATTVHQAREYFKEAVDLYVSGETPISAIPSTIVRFRAGIPELLRVGPVSGETVTKNWRECQT